MKIRDFFIYICSKPQRVWQESMVQDSGALQSSDRELRLRSPLFADLQSLSAEHAQQTDGELRSLYLYNCYNTA